MLTAMVGERNTRRCHQYRRSIRSWTLRLLLLVLFPASLIHVQAALHSSPRDFVKTDGRCYESNARGGGTIKVRFATGTMSTMQNWLGLIMTTATATTRSSDTAPTTTTTTILSQWACGNRDEECQQQHHDGTVTLVEFDLTTAEGALPPAEYHILLKSYGYHGRMLQLQSEPFQILPIGAFCSYKDMASEGQEDDYIGLILNIEQPLALPPRQSTLRHRTTVEVNQDQERTTVVLLDFAFERKNPQPNDAIGIYCVSDDVSLQELLSTTPPLLWLWTQCVDTLTGSESSNDDAAACREHGGALQEGDFDSTAAIPHGILSFVLSTASSLPSSPLQSMQYQAVLGPATKTTIQDLREQFDDDDGENGDNHATTTTRTTIRFLEPVVVTAPFFVAGKTTSATLSNTNPLLEGED